MRGLQDLGDVLGGIQQGSPVLTVVCHAHEASQWRSHSGGEGIGVDDLGHGQTPCCAPYPPHLRHGLAQFVHLLLHDRRDDGVVVNDLGGCKGGEVRSSHAVGISGLPLSGHRHCQVEDG